MDHNEAVRLNAAEKYLLGELSKEHHAAYEEHYFDCPACAEELKATVAFMESARQTVCRAAAQPVGDKELDRKDDPVRSWFDWLRPSYAIPVLLALILCIGYQNGVTIPNLRRGASHPVTAEIVKSFSLMSIGARGQGASSLTVTVGPREDFGFDVDMPGNSPTGYTCEIQDEAGKVLFTLPVSADEAKRSIHINISGGSLPPGKYSLVIFAGQSSPLPRNRASAADQKPFVIEFQP